MNKVMLKLGYRCNNNCLFCHAEDKHACRDLSYQEVVEKIRLVKRRGFRFVILSGGEPTIRRDFIRIARYVHGAGMKLGVVTNGRMFSYKPFFDHVMKAGLEYAYVSLHGDRDVHNMLCRSDSFDQTVRGIGNLSKLDGIELIVNCVVNKKNLHLLRKVAGICSDAGSGVIKFSNMMCKGAALKISKMVVPEFRVSVPAVREAIDYASSIGLDARFDGFPLCLMYGYQDALDNLETNNITHMSESDEREIFRADSGTRIRAGPCEKCEIVKCQGVDEGYLRMFGRDELKPAVRVSNSFTYTKMAESGFTDCPMKIFKGFDGRRDLFVSDGSVVFHFRTNTGDFSYEDIDRTINLGQLYLSVSAKARSGDFSRDYRKLNRTACKFCGKEHVFKASEEDVFMRDDRVIRREISRLRGKVLDVGCGEVRYGGALSGLVGRGDVRYIGIEPEKKYSSSARRKYPGLNILNCRFEDFKADGKFDSILFLRSINHFPVPDYVLEKACGMLKDNGLMLLCDNVAFGSVGLSGSEMKAGKGSWEHYHLHGPDDIIEMVQHLPLTVTGRGDISGGSANQWHLKLRKVAC